MSELKDDYNRTSDGIAVFQMQLADRAQAEGWLNKSTGDIINIPKDRLDPSHGVINVIKQHTQISIDALTTWATNNLLKNTVNQKIQNNERMKKFLLKTITKECMVDMNMKESQYTERHHCTIIMQGNYVKFRSRYHGNKRSNKA